MITAILTQNQIDRIESLSEIRFQAFLKRFVKDLLDDGFDPTEIVAYLEHRVDATAAQVLIDAK